MNQKAFVNPLKKKILAKEITFGTYVSMCDPCVCDIVGRLGYDFIWVDTEHTYMSLKDVLAHITAARGTGTPVLVRVPANDLSDTKKVIDMGPDGIIFPMMRTVEEVNLMISATLYPPKGARGFGPMGAIHYGIDDATEFVENTENNLCRFIQIEHIDAINCLDEIMENRYIDGYIFGPNDLSGSIGELLHMFDKNTTLLMEKAIAKLKAKGKYVGVATTDTDIDTLNHWKSMGMDMITVGSDYNSIRINAQNALATLRSLR